MPDFNSNTLNDGVIDFDRMNLNSTEMADLISELTGEMLAAAEALEFERAADLRDQIKALKKEKSAGLLDTRARVNQRLSVFLTD